MSRACFDLAVAETFRHEEASALRRFGVTRELYAEHAGIFREEVNLTRLDEYLAQTILRRWVWDRIEGDRLPAGVDIVMFDAAVVYGVIRAIVLMQSLLRDREDGVASIRMLTGINAYLARYGVETLINAYSKSRGWHIDRNATEPTPETAGARKRNQSVTAVALAASR